ncbi:molecular chaperone HtpG [Chloroflexi bacterium TSY]|nr:molecular chaperone HtpG [Chloroflexi bacterium TSY]
MSEKPEAFQSLEYRTEVKQLLDILAHSLYTDRDIFLRELISNASDALNRIQFEMLTNQNVVDPEAELAIRITVDEDEKRIQIHDTGIGMNRDELVENLGTIAHSGAKSFLQSASESQNGTQQSINEIIGQFGVGFYSAFMVAAEMTVTSRSYRPDDESWAWSSTGDSTYTLQLGEQAERGTTIDIKLKADAEEYASVWKLESIVRKHSDYVSFPIYVVRVEKPEEADESSDDEPIEDAKDAEIEVEKEPEPVNKQTAIWRQQMSQVKQEEYEEFYKQLTYDFEKPLMHLHLVTDAPADIRSILFVPSKRERGMMGMNQDRGIKLYSRKILIQDDNKALLPEYFRFIEGVVDSEDLPLNVSRETVQSNPMIRQIQRALVGRINRDLKALARKEPAKYATFWSEFGVFLKEGVATDPSSQEALVDLLRFHSSKSAQGIAEASSDSVEEAVDESTDEESAAEDTDEQGTDSSAEDAAETPKDTSGLTSLIEYVDRMKPDQEDIYYVLGDDLKSAEHSPHLDYFRANDIEVLYMVDPIDGYMTTMLREYDDKKLKNVDDASLDLPESEKDDEKKEEKVAQDDFDKLVERFKSVLGDRVTDVSESKQLVGSPCRLVTPEGSMDRDLQRIMRLTQQDYETPKKLLELNRNHATIANLAQIVNQSGGEAIINPTIEQLFANAQLLDGTLPNPAEMVDHIQALMDAAVEAKAGKG